MEENPIMRQHNENQGESPTSQMHPIIGLWSMRYVRPGIRRSSPTNPR